MNFLYFHVVSGDTSFFFTCLGAKVSVPGGRKLPAATGLEGKLWFGALLEYFLRESLSIISLLVWQVQKPGAGLNSAKRECI